MAIGPKNDPVVNDTAPKSRDTIVLVGLMGAGKSCVGRRLAESLGVPFVDSDEEIEKAAGCGVTDIFDVYGEPAFRDCERRVIARLLSSGPSIIATGGGAFMDPETRETIKATSTSVWLRADPEILYQRTKRSKTRPLLATKDPRAKLVALAEVRYPVYAEADITVDTGNESLDTTVKKVAEVISRNAEAGAPK